MNAGFLNHQRQVNVIGSIGWSHWILSILAYDKVSGLNPCNVGHLEIHGLKEVKDIAGMLQMH